eukprot:15365340-Ditylum_brightwellii.AAC.1
MELPHCWTDPAPNKKWSEPDFNEVTSKRGQKKMVKKEYKARYLPTDYAPVPMSIDSNTGWELHEPIHQNGSDSIPPDGDELFPPNHRGCLDAGILCELGMSHQIIDENNKEFWCMQQPLEAILFKSGKHVNFDGYIIRDSVRGGSNGAIYRQWQQGTNYDDVMAMSMSYIHFLQIKCTRKICNNDSAKKKKEDGYNPAHKYNYIYDTIFPNVNAFTCYVDLDLCGDVATFEHNNYEEPGSGLVGQVRDKPSITKGGQIILIFGVSRVRPHAYLYHHNLHKLPPGWTVKGQYEVLAVLEKLKPMIEGEGEIKRKYTDSIHAAFGLELEQTVCSIPA